MKKVFSLALLIIIVAATLVIALPRCNNGEAGSNTSTGNNDGNTTNVPAPRQLNHFIDATYPHDTSSFTEGLLVYKGVLYESTGLKGRSKILKTDLKTGKILMEASLPAEYFGEGIVIVNDTVYQLTYQEKKGFMYAVKDFKKLGEFKFASEEGWGMTTDGKQIIASDGTSTLYFYEPGTFKLLRTQVVTESGNLAFNINELEYIDGYIYANQWQSPYILKIDPATGYVVGKADMTQLASRIKNTYPTAEYLNGIAHDAATKKTYITGKNWPELY